MKNVARLLWLLVIAGLGLYVALTLWLSWSAIMYPYALDYGEGDVFWFTRKLAHGQNIYTPFGGPPFDSANYPPVAMLLTASLYPLYGDMLTFGRWLNFAAALIAAAFIVRWIKSETRNGRAAWLAAGLFLGSTFVYHWIPLYRVDFIGLAFSLAGIFCVWRWEQVVSRDMSSRTARIPNNMRDDVSKSPVASQKILFLGLAICFFLLALYTKHSLFLAPAAATLAIFLRERRTAVFFALILGAIGGAIFWALEILTQGGWSFGIIALNATVWTPRVFAPLVTSFFVTYAIVLGLAALGWWARIRQRKFGVLEIYAIVSLASLALAGREGAWENYFLEVIVMASVFAGIAIANLARTGFVRFALPILLLIQLALFWNEHDPRSAASLMKEVRIGNERYAALLRQTAGTALAEDMGLLWKHGKAVEYYSFVYSTLARAGRYDQKWETENLRAGNFPLVILNQGTREDVDKFGNFTRVFVSALDYGYAVLSEDTRYVVYAPAPLQNFEPRVIFDETLELVGWTLEPEELRPGEELQLTLVWRALKSPPTRYTMFAQLAKANAGNIAQDDHEPHSGAYPTTNWAEGEMVRETFRLRVPSELKTGAYVLRIGWYETATQDRLSTAEGAEVIELKTFVVK